MRTPGQRYPSVLPISSANHSSAFPSPSSCGEAVRTMTMAAATTQAIAVREPSSYAIMQRRSSRDERSAGRQRRRPEDQPLRPGRGQGAERRHDRLDDPGHHRGRDHREDDLEGIVILQRSVRSWWKEDIEEKGGGSPPDCSSQDGIWGRRGAGRASGLQGMLPSTSRSLRTTRTGILSRSIAEGSPARRARSHSSAPARAGAARHASRTGCCSCSRRTRRCRWW
jgi:hypothetical protein